MISWDLVYYVLRAEFDGVKSEYIDIPKKRDGEGKTEYEYGCKATTLKDEGDKVVVNL